MKYGWTQPCCTGCWNERNPDRPATRARINDMEKCVYCGDYTESGIYIRIDPEVAPHPSLAAKS